MPISTLDPKALARLTPQQIADLAFQAWQDRRRALAAGQAADADAFDAEFERLAQAFQHA